MKKIVSFFFVLCTLIAIFSVVTPAAQRTVTVYNWGQYIGTGEDDTIDVIVGNRIFLKELTDIQRRIRATMAQRLHNGQIEVNIRLAKASEIKPILTPRQELEKMKEQNQAIGKLMAKLNLDLS